ncbi:MAG: creatininase family protein [Ilumatobacteraceae bacterium]|uniref:creatininase family protein n=1 Tax=Ilumatobacter fluminis TaxID=467091 RepID=UPI002967BAC0|nr:creatininase family protein [Ilumatobacteraceae bacterium]
MPTRLAELTWPEVESLATADAVVIVPVGTIEQHGPHLPLDTDNRIAEGFASRAVRASEPSTVIVGPTVPFGLSEHLADFPGAVFHSTDTLIAVLTEVFVALARSGFRRVLAVNGHGSNVAPLDLASREALFRCPDHLFASVSWWELADVRDVAVERGPATTASHACAFETSLMMALAPELVHPDRMEPGQAFPTSPHIWRDTLGRQPDEKSKRPIHITEPWSGWSDNGVRGDPRGASAELGEAMLDAGGAELAAVVSELRARAIMTARSVSSDH